jgi:glutamate racemase
MSILRHIHALLPQQDLLYFADSGFAPYGEKPEAEIVARALHIAQYLLGQGAQALVVACNTATVAAIRLLRQHYPDLPLVGVEPGLKPAAAVSRSRIVGVLATAYTLRGEKFIQLQQQISAQSRVQFLLQPCTGLVDLIELGQIDSSDTLALLQRYIPPLLDQGADTLVLGCTHYPFVQVQIERVIAQHQASQLADAPAITLIDTGEAVARQLQRLLGAHQIPPNPHPTQLKGFTSGSASALQQAFWHLLELQPPVEAVEQEF